MIEKLVKKALDLLYGRNLKTSTVGNKVIAFSNCLEPNYSLQGTYTFEEVQKLNNLTNHSVRYGFCLQKRAFVAIIGIPEEDIFSSFKEVFAYGEIPSSGELDFLKLTEKESKKMESYIVYGLEGMKQISRYVKFDKIEVSYDSRYLEVRDSHEHRILQMKAKLEGHYTFEETIEFAKQQEIFAVDRNIVYATLEDGEHIAIMSFKYSRKDEVAGFKDVWEIGKPEPITQRITFLTYIEEKDIKNFSIYLYDYLYFQGATAPALSKLDRSFSSDFDFYDIPDGKDMRLPK